MPLPLTVSCFNKIQIGFTFLVPADPGSPGKRAVIRVCVMSVLLDKKLGSFSSAHSSAIQQKASEELQRGGNRSSSKKFDNAHQRRKKELLVASGYLCKTWLTSHYVVSSSPWQQSPRQPSLKRWTSAVQAVTECRWLMGRQNFPARMPCTASQLLDRQVCHKSSQWCRVPEAIVVWPTTSCFADWLKRRHVTLRIFDCQACRHNVTSLARDIMSRDIMSRAKLVTLCCKYCTSCLVTSSIPGRSLNQT